MRNVQTKFGYTALEGYFWREETRIAQCSTKIAQCDTGIAKCLTRIARRDAGIAQRDGVSESGFGGDCLNGSN